MRGHAGRWATPYLDLTRGFNEVHIDVTYADVLLVSEVLEGKGATPHHEEAVHRLHRLPEVMKAIQEAVRIEQARRETIQRRGVNPSLPQSV